MAYRSDLRAYASSFDARAARAREALGRIVERVAQDRARVKTGRMREQLRFDPRLGQLQGGAPETLFNEYGTEHMSGKAMLRPAFEVMSDTVGDEYERAFD